MDTLWWPFSLSLAQWVPLLWAGHVCEVFFFLLHRNCVFHTRRILVWLNGKNCWTSTKTFKPSPVARHKETIRSKLQNKISLGTMTLSAFWKIDLLIQNRVTYEMWKYTKLCIPRRRGGKTSRTSSISGAWV